MGAFFLGGITLAQAQAKLQGWLDAEDRLQESQAVTFADRSLIRSRLDHVSERIEYWERKVNRLEQRALNGGRTVRGVTPIG